MRWMTSPSLSPVANRSVRRALLLGHTLGLQERPLIENGRRPDYFVFTMLGVVAAGLAVLIAVS